MRIVICTYCLNQAELVSGKEIYPNLKHLHERNYWRCRPCDAHVGTHKDTDRPLGHLANSELRKWKIRAHTALDALWKDSNTSRRKAYLWLAYKLGIKENDCHVGKFDLSRCKKVVAICK